MLGDTSENRSLWHHEYTYHSPNGQPENRSQIDAALTFPTNVPSLPIVYVGFTMLGRSVVSLTMVMMWRRYTSIFKHYCLILCNIHPQTMKWDMISLQLPAKYHKLPGLVVGQIETRI